MSLLITVRSAVEKIRSAGTEVAGVDMNRFTS